jgi:hypothetical protein
VRCGAVVINAVALVQDLGMLTDLNLQGAGDDDVALLTLMGVRGMS